MTKFIKWFLFSLVFCGGLALAICYMVIPNETKSAADIVIGYLNTPIGIAGGTTITIGMVAYIVVANLLKLNREKAKQDFDECKEELELEKNKLENEVKEIKDLYFVLQENLNTLLQAHNITTTSIYDTLKLIPNKKVQEKVEELYGTREERTND